MAPKNKITKDEIIDAALALIEDEGKDELNARSLARAMGVSTQPIFSNFNGMSELKAEISKKATEIYFEYIKETLAAGIYPAYKSSGMAYIRFARERRELFKLMFMDGAGKYMAEAYNDIVRNMAKSLEISEEEAFSLHLKMWVFVHGIATMAATEYLEFTDDYASTMISDVYMGLTEKYRNKKEFSVQ